jgi:pilus assembly protein CpaE
VFSAILLAQNDGACLSIEDLATESQQVSFEKTLYRFPQTHELARILNGHSPDLVFLDLSDWEGALAAAAHIRALSPRSAIVGFGAGWNQGQEEECAAAGVTELLVSPVTMKKFEDSVDHAIHKMTGAIQENLFAFLPSKAGSGATTIALNTAGYMADGSSRDPISKKVLLIEADLNSGVISVLLDIEHPYSLADALDNSAHLDYSQWTRFIVKRHGFDLLLSDHPRRTPLPSWSNYHHLLDYAAARYDRILVDLPEVVNDATIETVRRAKRVFIVCTPELASLALAPHRSQELTSRGVPAEKIGLILNRWHKGDVGARDLEEMLKHKVDAVFPNDYRTVTEASGSRGVVSSGTKLGKSFAEFARKLSGAPDVPAGGLSFLKGFGARPSLQPHA